MGFYEGAQKVVVGADIFHFDSVGIANSHDPRVGGGSLYLRTVLKSYNI